MPYLSKLTRTLSLAALTACGAASPPPEAPVAPAAPTPAEQALAATPIFEATLVVEPTDQTEEPSPYALSLTTRNGSEPPEHRDLPPLSGGLSTPLTGGAIGVATFFAGGGEEVHLERDGTALVATRLHLDELEGPGDDDPFAVHERSDDTTFVMRVQGPDSLIQLAECASTRVFECTSSAASISACVDSDRVHAAIHTPAAHLVIDAPVSAILRTADGSTTVLRTLDDSYALGTRGNEVWVRTREGDEVVCQEGRADFTALDGAPTAPLPAWVESETPR